MMSRQSAARLESLYRLYASRVAALAYRRTGDHHAAQDVAGETWLRAARSLESLRADDQAAFGWLAAIVRHAAADRYRPAHSREMPMDWGDAVSGRCLPAVPAAEQVAMTAPAAVLPAAWRAAVETLPAAQREALLGRCEGLSWAAVGWHAGRHRSTVSGAARRGARTLRPLVAAGAVSA